MFEPAWLPGDSAGQPDTRVAFRGTFELARSCAVEFRVLGASWFTAFLDGEFLIEGPARFPPTHPEFEIVTRLLPAGRHVIAASVHHHGLETRMLRDLPPFFWCQARCGGELVELNWKAAVLRAYKASGVRISKQFAWIDWVDTRALPVNWHALDFDVSGWTEPVAQDLHLGEFRPLRINSLHHPVVKPKLIEQGTLTGPFDISDKPDWPNEGDVAWYKRNLHPTTPATGAWRRYDLGRVRLGVPKIQLDLPAGAVVEFAYSEALYDRPIVDGYEEKIVVTFDEPDATRDPRVVPYIPLSYPTSRNLDHFIARGGVQTFAPGSPRGGRYIEVHTQADPQQVKLLNEEYVEREYFSEPVGSFESDDPLLNRIWALGVETLRACSEDAIIDNPTRERGQWTGDVLLSMYIAAAAYNDPRLFRRGIEQSAYCARDDGLIAGLNPGGPSFLSTYAAQWVTSVLNYFDLTGNHDLLDEMHPFAVRNFDAFEKRLGPDGIDKDLAWCFIDWGYPAPIGPSDAALNIHVHEGARNMIRWCRILGHDSTRYEQLATRLHSIISKSLSPFDFSAIGYHKTVLALRGGFIPDSKRRQAIGFIKHHMQSCFPNNPDAPRLSGPKVSSAQLITPYFSYYAFPVLIDAGEMDFVLDQMRHCWGWGLNQGLTTQPEVFDLNWSHCHVWASSPTAQLTQFALGLRAHFSLGMNHFDFRLIPGSLRKARGRVPIPFGEGAIEIDWLRNDDGSIQYAVESPVDVWLHAAGSTEATHVRGGRPANLKVNHG